MHICVGAALALLAYDDAFDDEPSVAHDVNRRRIALTHRIGLEGIANAMTAYIDTQFELKPCHTSVLRVRLVDKLTVHYDRYRPTRGCVHVALIESIKAQKTCIHIKHEDTRCFNVTMRRAYNASTATS